MAASRPSALRVSSSAALTVKTSAVESADTVIPSWKFSEPGLREGVGSAQALLLFRLMSQSSQTHKDSVSTDLRSHGRLRLSHRSDWMCWGRGRAASGARCACEGGPRGCGCACRGEQEPAARPNAKSMYL